MSVLPFRELLAAALAVIGFAASAQAGTYNFTGIGSGSDGALSASSAITTGAGTISVTLANTLAANAFISPGQALSDFSFTLSNAPGALGSTTAFGQLGTIGANGVVTYNTGAGSTSPTRYFGVGGGAFTIVGNTVTLEVIGGGQPTQMIAPAVANGGSYPNANGGLKTNFDPYVIGPATFTLALAGVTANTGITATTFSFGTAPDTFIGGTCTTTGGCGGGGSGGGGGGGNPMPEPVSMALLGTGLLGLGLARRRMK